MNFVVPVTEHHHPVFPSDELRKVTHPVGFEIAQVPQQPKNATGSNHSGELVGRHRVV